MEATLNKYRAKLEEVNSLRQHLKDLEEQNSQYLDKILDLESSVKTIPTLKAQIESYKDKVVDLETGLVELRANSSVKEQKLGRLQEELEAAQSKGETFSCLPSFLSSSRLSPSLPSLAISLLSVVLNGFIWAVNRRKGVRRRAIGGGKSGDGAA